MGGKASRGRRKGGGLGYCELSAVSFWLCAVFGHRAANGRRVGARVGRMEYRFLAVESGFYEME